jgi:hypothetical protein
LLADKGKMRAGNNCSDVHKAPEPQLSPERRVLETRV